MGVVTVLKVSTLQNIKTKMKYNCQVNQTNSMIKTALKTTILGSASIIIICFLWYTVWGEGKNKGDYWTAYDLDKICIQTQNPSSWSCYRAEIHRQNALELADWGMKCGLIGTIATVGLGLINKK